MLNCGQEPSLRKVTPAKSGCIILIKNDRHSERGLSVVFVVYSFTGVLEITPFSASFKTIELIFLISSAYSLLTRIV